MFSGASRFHGFAEVLWGSLLSASRVRPHHVPSMGPLPELESRQLPRERGNAPLGPPPNATVKVSPKSQRFRNSQISRFSLAYIHESRSEVQLLIRPTDFSDKEGLFCLSPPLSKPCPLPVAGPDPGRPSSAGMPAMRSPASASQRGQPPLPARSALLFGGGGGDLLGPPSW